LKDRHADKYEISCLYTDLHRISSEQMKCMALYWKQFNLLSQHRILLLKACYQYHGPFSVLI
jgi:hypothetical protein